MNKVYFYTNYDIAFNILAGHAAEAERIDLDAQGPWAAKGAAAQDLNGSLAPARMHFMDAALLFDRADSMRASQIRVVSESKENAKRRRDVAAEAVRDVVEFAAAVGDNSPEPVTIVLFWDKALCGRSSQEGQEIFAEIMRQLILKGSPKPSPHAAKASQSQGQTPVDKLLAGVDGMLKAQEAEEMDALLQWSLRGLVKAKLCMASAEDRGRIFVGKSIHGTDIVHWVPPHRRVEFLFLLNQDHFIDGNPDAWRVLSAFGLSYQPESVLGRCRDHMRRAWKKSWKKCPREGEFPIDGESIATLRLCRDLYEATMTRRHVFLEGETGTGKEHAAEVIHYCSEVLREKKAKEENTPFERVNCAALPANLADSLLFGHVKGAFTGAEQDKDGYLARANGTIFLDEIQSLPPEVFPKLLRFLQSGEYTKLGGSAIETSSARVIVATNRLQGNAAADTEDGELWKKMELSGFLQRFQHRIVLPTLNERRRDFDRLVTALFVDCLGGMQKDKLLRTPNLATVQKWRQWHVPFFEMLKSADWTNKNVRGLKAEIHAWILRCIEEFQYHPRQVAAPLKKDAATSKAKRARTDARLAQAVVDAVKAKDGQKMDLVGVIADAIGYKPRKGKSDVKARNLAVKAKLQRLCQRLSAQKNGGLKSTIKSIFNRAFPKGKRGRPPAKRAAE